MNWNWLPMVGGEQNDDKDLISESEVIDECDHSFEQETELLDNPTLGEAVIEDGHLVIPQYEVVTEHCEKCGEPGMDGEAYPYDSSDATYLAPYRGKWTRVARKLAFEPTFEMDPDRSVSDAMTEPVDDEDDEPGRVLVNTSESETGYGITD